MYFYLENEIWAITANSEKLTSELASTWGMEALSTKNSNDFTANGNLWLISEPLSDILTVWTSEGISSEVSKLKDFLLI